MAVLARLPRVSWQRFFHRLTPQGQGDLEFALSESGLLLGEFMELVERAYLEAYLLRESSLGRERIDLPAAGRTIARNLLSSYISRKRLFLLLRVASEGLAWAKLSGAFPGDADAADFLRGAPYSQTGLSPSQKLRLRQRIHAQIEVMRRAGA